MKFPFVKQTDSKLCGLACLSSICKYYGEDYSLNYLLDLCDIHSDGVSMLSLSKAAQTLGFKTLCVSIPYVQLLLVDSPCILHWNQTHYVVLYRIDSKKENFYISDPAKGKYSLSKQELLEHWFGANSNAPVLMLEPNKKFGTIKEKSRQSHSSFAIILGYLRTYHKYVLQLAIGLLFTSVLQVVFPIMTQIIVDKGIQSRNINLLWWILACWMIIVLAKTLTEMIRKWILLHITMRVNVSLISDFIAKLLSLPMSYFESHSIGDLSQRVGDHNRVQIFLTSQLLDSTFSVITFLVFSVILLIYNKAIFAIFMLGSLLYTLWILLFLKRRKLIDYETFEVEAANQSKTYQILASIQEIKLQNCRTRRRWEWEDLQAVLFSIKQKALRLQQIEESGSVFITEIKNILITVFSASLVIYDQLTLGEMMAISFIVGQLNSPLYQIMGLIYSFQDMKISLERINEVHYAKSEAEQFGELRCIERSSIQLSHVYFKYDRSIPIYAIEDVSVELEAGKVTAIVGWSGSGKTTLVKLMLGYYNNYAGEIKISGINMRNFNIDWVRTQFGVVMQDGFIFTESIARNIAVDDNDIDWERLDYAARISNIKDYIDKLPLGYNTLIGREGMGLSQGQKQRILIARALYKNPRFLILDEATNALDATNECIIVNNLAKFCHDKTVLVVAHRLSTVRNADRIIVLHQGRVVEVGSHDSLIDHKGHYYNLIKNQLELSE